MKLYQIIRDAMDEIDLSESELKIFVALLNCTIAWDRSAIAMTHADIRAYTGLGRKDLNVPIGRLVEPYRMLLPVELGDRNERRAYAVQPDVRIWRAPLIQSRDQRIRLDERIAAENLCRPRKLDLVTEQPSLVALMADAVIESHHPLPEARERDTVETGPGRMSWPAQESGWAAVHAAVELPPAGRPEFGQPSGNLPPEIRASQNPNEKPRPKYGHVPIRYVNVLDVQRSTSKTLTSSAPSAGRPGEIAAEILLFVGEYDFKKHWVWHLKQRDRLNLDDPLHQAAVEAALIDARSRIDAKITVRKTKGAMLWHQFNIERDALNRLQAESAST